MKNKILLLSSPVLALVTFFVYFELPAASAKQPLKAIFALLEGTVTVRDVGHGEREPGQLHRATLLKVISVDDQVRVAPGGAAGLVCSSDRWVEVSEGTEKSISEQFCRQGRRLKAGTFARLAKSFEKAKSLNGAMAFERLPRGDGESGDLPVLFAPRNTEILEGRPRLVWKTAKPGIFKIKSKGSVAFTLEVDPSRCIVSTSGAFYFCSVPYPEYAPAIEPGESIFLQVEDAGGKSGSPVGEDPPPWIRRSHTDQAEQLLADIRVISALPLKAEEHRQLRAELCSARGFFSMAIGELEAGDAPVESFGWKLTLGSLYLKVGLATTAETHFRQALRSTAQLDQARAAYGLGQTLLVLRDREAIVQLRQAEKLFQGLEMAAEAQSVRQVAAAASARF